ncbi:CPBP family intramembrane glutamic endopeptidase [Bradyrhizobium sp. HKCCYLS1011]|uniref:CPBP family intramembrane glutamic endopeptidase n=1 Tax=Bradyrhizobium sp. HKCCYLS1011 TaxID=3420733 RepID=UPI003EC08D13
MIVVQWSFILAGALLMVCGVRLIALGVLAIGYVLAFINGQLDLFAVPTLVLLVAAAACISPKRPRWLQILGHVVFIILTLGLSYNLLPGFHNQRVIGPTQFTPDAIPFSMYLNLDKPLAAYWRVLASPFLALSRPKEGWPKAAIAAALTIAACIIIALLTRFATWEPKWPQAGWLWALNNLLLVAFAEEAMFRGYLQEGLGRAMSRCRLGPWLAILIAAVLFGLAHFRSGAAMIGLASIAGIGYGTAYRFAGLRGSMLTHFVLNATHFLLFTYPALVH